MDSSISTLGIIFSQQHLMHPITIGGKYSDKSINLLTTKEKAVAVISAIAIGILFSALLITKSPVVLIVGVGLATYFTFSLMTAKIKCFKISQYLYLNPPQAPSTHYAPLPPRKTDAEIKIDQLKQQFESELSKVMKISNEQEAEEYLANWKSHYDDTYLFPRELKSTTVSRRLQGMQVMMSYLFNCNERRQNLQNDRDDNRPPRYTETCGVSMCQQISGMIERIGTPFLFNYIECKEKEFLISSWVTQKDNCENHQVTIESAIIEDGTVKVLSHELVSQ